MNTLTCQVPIATLFNSYGYHYGDTVRATVRAKNVNGWSTYSPLNTVGAIISSTPGNMNLAYYGNGTTAITLEVTWDQLITNA